MPIINQKLTVGLSGKCAPQLPVANILTEHNCLIHLNIPLLRVPYMPNYRNKQMPVYFLRLTLPATPVFHRSLMSPSLAGERGGGV